MAPHVITSDNNNNNNNNTSSSSIFISESEKENTKTPEEMARLALLCVPGITFIDGPVSKIGPGHPRYADEKIIAKHAARRAAKRIRNGGIRKKKETEKR